MQPIVLFKDSALGTLARVGGKGKNLVDLASANFPVPPGFVVTADAYLDFIERLEWLDAALEAIDFQDPSRLSKQCSELRRRLAVVELPDRIKEAIAEAMNTMQQDGATRFAVRSSSTLEDLAQAAFAGQHDTFLNVRGVENVVTKVRECFISLWGDRAVLYRHHQGYRQQDVQMAVVVQQQIDCDKAGVGFSMDPVSGRTGQMIIDANYGLGESVVAGECEVDHLTLDKATLSVVAESIGHKDLMIAATLDGTEVEQVDPQLAQKPCLKDAEILRIGQLLTRVERHYGWPQDIEWGFGNGQLYLFQSRAVTTLQPRFTRDESAERFPNAMTPLSWDFLGAVFRDSLAYSLRLMNLPPLNEDWFTLIDHYVYGNQNAVELLAAYRPIHAESLEDLVTEIPTIREKFSWVLELPVRWARDLDRYLIRLGHLSSVPLDDMSVPEIWQFILRLQEIATDYFHPNIAISITQSFLHRLLLHLVTTVLGKEDGLRIFDGLMAGCDTKTAVVNREIHELASLARRDEKLKHAILEQGGRVFCESRSWRQFPDFEGRFDRFIEDHGHRELDMDYAQPTWSDAPWVVLDSIALILRQPPQEHPSETARRQRIEFASTELHFLSAVPEPLRFFFSELIRLSRTYTVLDDLEHYQTTRANPLARRAALVMGNRLVEHGIIDVAEDIFFFRAEALENLVGEYPTVDIQKYRQSVYEAKASFQRANAGTPKWSLDEEELSEESPLSGDTLRGLPGSPGNVSGRCYLVNSPDDFAKFPAGGILVARTTNPAWTPLFYSASGLITESGGPLSHGAVTAREMRLPAVMSVRGVMSLLSDDETVTVDGSRGIVVRGDQRTDG
jgi:phosphoenolpyruvate synthase/pyruvate phosphate dikinase